METWQEPPPWTALPIRVNWPDCPGVKISVAAGACFEPTAPGNLQGKFAPEASRGELSVVPVYGAGTDKATWAPTKGRRAAAAAIKDVLNCILDMFEKLMVSRNS